MRREEGGRRLHAPDMCFPLFSPLSLPANRDGEKKNKRAGTSQNARTHIHAPHLSKAAFANRSQDLEVIKVDWKITEVNYSHNDDIHYTGLFAYNDAHPRTV